jgi:hypothetical protein
VIVVPNESILVHDAYARALGELTQSLLDSGADYGASVEVDTRERTRPGEERAGASPLGGIALYLGQAVSTAALGVMIDRTLEVAIEWVRRHQPRSPFGGSETSVTIYGPDGEVLKEVHVEDDGSLGFPRFHGQGGVPPVP